MKTKIIIGKNATLKNFIDEEDEVIGVDYGAYLLALNGIYMDLAIGDFDSCSSAEFSEIEKFAKKVIKLNPIKDETDTLEAIKYASGDKIFLVGSIQGMRIEHFYANLNLVKKYNNLTLIDDNTKIEKISSTKLLKSKYKFYSIFAINDIKVSLSGFKYPLTNYKLTPLDNLCISNELVEKEGFIEINGSDALLISSIADNLLA